MITLCHWGCGRQAPTEHMIRGWRTDCAGALLDEIRMLQLMKPDDLGMLVAFLRDRGARLLAGAAIGSIPYEREAGRDGY